MNFVATPKAVNLTKSFNLYKSLLFICKERTRGDMDHSLRKSSRWGRQKEGSENKEEGTIGSLETEGRAFPGGPVVKTPRFHCRGCGFNPWVGTKIPHTAGPKEKTHRG